jgi:hypothetical protein
VRKVVIDFQIGLIAIAVAIVIGVLVAEGAVEERSHVRDTVSVTGSAKKPIDADLAMWRLVVAADDRRASRAARRLERQVRQVRTFLRRGGLEQTELELPPLHREVYERRITKKRSIRIVRVEQVLEITTRDLDTVEALGRDLTSLVTRGIDVTAERIAFVSTRLVQARIEALDAATENARHRAETIVEGLGGKLGRLRRAELGVYQVTPRFSTDVSDYGINDTSSREKDVTAVLGVTFEVKR